MHLVQRQPGSPRFIRSLAAFFLAAGIAVAQAPADLPAADGLAATGGESAESLRVGDPGEPATHRDPLLRAIHTDYSLLLAEGMALDVNLQPALRPGPNPAKSDYQRKDYSEPSETRVKQIQQILFDQGYLRGDNAVDGDWGPKSKEALRSFQRDHGLRDDGKLGALSLTELGLGPKHEPIGEIPVRSQTLLAAEAGAEPATPSAVAPRVPVAVDSLAPNANAAPEE